MDELEEDADDYDEYDMDQGSEGDMEGGLFPSISSFCPVNQTNILKTMISSTLGDGKVTMRLLREDHNVSVEARLRLGPLYLNSCQVGMVDLFQSNPTTVSTELRSRRVVTMMEPILFWCVAIAGLIQPQHFADREPKPSLTGLMRLSLRVAGE